MAEGTNFDVLRISIASPQDIRSWSRGEVKKPETINYRTFKPERDGLFCERIFGPTKDWECHCGKYKKIKFKGIICDKCGVEVTRSKVRRRRMGHIELAAPVAHIWYVKGVPSPMALLLDMSPRLLEKVLYFASYVVTRVDRGAISRAAETIRAAAQEEIEEIESAAQARLAEFRRQLADLDAGIVPVGRRTGGSARPAKDKSPDRQAARSSVPEGEEAVLEALVAAESIPDEVVAQAVVAEAETAETAGDSEPEDAETARRRLLEDIRSEETSCSERVQQIQKALEDLWQLEKKKLLMDPEFRNLQRLMEAVGRKTGKTFDKLFSVGLGAEAVLELLEDLDLEKLNRELRKTIEETPGAKRARAIKRLEIVEAFRKSKIRPEWMILEVIPVMPPELRPMVQLDGGRFATSDLNDLYRRIINRNNRLKRIIEIRAPESIINHEKRLLQEAVDALIDNTRRPRPVAGSNGRPLKSLSDMLKGKQGRFRKNLLGKRVDYSGRSVIVVGPHLRLHECGLPKEMALELFKPFVMKRLVEKGYTTNIKTAKRMVDRLKPEVWDALEEVIRERPVLLNRAPTLHRLGIQAFEPVLVDGKAIQIHPLVCPAFNADFDGDQMAVHVPLFPAAQAEARMLMLSSSNLFSPADGHPVMSPEYDIVLGCYYLTQINPEAKGAGKVFSNTQEAILAYEMGEMDLHAPIRVRVQGSLLNTTTGRVIFNEVLPEGWRVEEVMDKSKLKEVIAECHRRFGSEATVRLLDSIKSLGFRFATRAGITIALSDMNVPSERNEIVRRTEEAVEKTNRDYERAAISAGERLDQIVEHWIRAAEEVADAILRSIDRFNPFYMMANSGARGSTKQISQIVGMRGLMAEPSGRFIEDLPIKSNFHEGLSLLEYFISTHGARKGLADTALRTADAGYLTRRLVDVSQDVIIRAEDCETLASVELCEIREGDEGVEPVETVGDRARGRALAEPVVDPSTGEVLAEAGDLVDPAAARKIDERGVEVVRVRSPLTCELELGLCALCYGEDLSTGQLVDIGEAVGIIAAQSIGEPGTQLTMRTFHYGGVAGQYLTGVAEVKKKKQQTLRELHEDIRRGTVQVGHAQADAEQKRAVLRMLKVLEESVRGLLRVVELFEARKPKGEAIVSDVDGIVVKIEQRVGRQVIIHSEQSIEALDFILGEKLAEVATAPRTRKALAESGVEITEKLLEEFRKAGVKTITVRKEYLVPYRGYLEVQESSVVSAGDRLTAGPLWPQRVLETKGVAAVQDYIVAEIQKVYKSQGVNINDKHVEVIVRQMLRKRKIKDAGDTELLPGQIVDRFAFEKENKRIRQQGGREAAADWVLLGITEAALATESFLSAASFQKTTKVLTEAAVKGKEDFLVGLKENVIIGRLIPAGTGMQQHSAITVRVEGEEDLLAAEDVPPEAALGMEPSRHEEGSLITDGLLGQEES